MCSRWTERVKNKFQYATMTVQRAESQPKVIGTGHAWDQGPVFTVWCGTGHTGDMARSRSWPGSGIHRVLRYGKIEISRRGTFTFMGYRYLVPAPRAHMNVA